MSVVPYLDEAEYLEREARSELRHEYVEGKLIAMAGETQEHEDIVLNIAEALRPIARKLGCRLYTNNIKLRVKGNRYRYPDVMVLCAPKRESRIETEPCCLVEVLSDSTESTDIGTKLDEYTRIPSLERYLIVSQNQRLVVMYRREGPNWLVETQEDGQVEIPCLGSALSLEQIYSGVATVLQQSPQT